MLDSKNCAERNVHWYVFGILECDEGFSDSKGNNFYRLENYGFTIVPNIWLNKENVSETVINSLKDWAKDCEIPYDGMVVSFNSISYSESLGQTSHHPLHSIAYKFKDETEETILRSVEWNTTRSGQINPTACFDTVILDNTEVSRASLFNLTFIKDMELNLLNSIQVSKRNMIIPYIEENLDRQKGNYIPIPKVCPSCGTKTEVRNTGTADFLYCNNASCPAKLVDKFSHFVSRDAMNIEGMSEATIEKFINRGWLKTFDDIYKLDQYKSEIVKMEGFGQRSYNNLIEAIERSKYVEFQNFVYSLGIDQIGKGGSRRLAKHFNNNIEVFLKAVNDQYDFTVIEDYGQITSDAVLYYFDEPANYSMVNRLLEYVIIKQEEKVQPMAFKNLSGLTFVITGAVYSFKNRDEFRVLVESLNGKVSGSVSNKTNYLVCNENAGSSKSQKAKALGVNVITEDEFNKMIGRNV
jgi:DNA ligase (NAD+)